MATSVLQTACAQVLSRESEIVEVWAAAFFSVANWHFNDCVIVRDIGFVSGGEYVYSSKCVGGDKRIGGVMCVGGRLDVEVKCGANT